MVERRIKTSGSLGLESYYGIIQSGDFTAKPPRLQFRNTEDSEQLQTLITTLQSHVSQITTAVKEMSGERQSLSETLKTTEATLQGKYYIPARVLTWMTFGRGGAEDPEVAVEREAIEDMLSGYHAERFEKDFPGKPNPFRFINHLFAQGVWPKGFRIVEGRELFVVDVPVVVTFKADSEEQKPRQVLWMGCWADGDTQLTYFHSINDDCEFNYDLMAKPLQTLASRKIEYEDFSPFFHDPPEIVLPDKS